MTTWLKKLRLYLLRRQLKTVNGKLNRAGWNVSMFEFNANHDFRADLINRIAEIEKTL